MRIPRKFDGSNRGFAFVEFSTRQEAKSALAALARYRHSDVAIHMLLLHNAAGAANVRSCHNSSHLYGRHLVLDWAEDKDVRGCVSTLLRPPLSSLLLCTLQDIATQRAKAKRDASQNVRSKA